MSKLIISVLAENGKEVGQEYAIQISNPLPQSCSSGKISSAWNYKKQFSNHELNFQNLI